MISLRVPGVRPRPHMHSYKQIIMNNPLELVVGMAKMALGKAMPESPEFWSVLALFRYVFAR